MNEAFNPINCVRFIIKRIEIITSVAGTVQINNVANQCEKGWLYIAFSKARIFSHLLIAAYKNSIINKIENTSIVIFLSMAKNLSLILSKKTPA